MSYLNELIQKLKNKNNILSQNIENTEDINTKDYLINALKNEDAWVRAEAAEALGELGDVTTAEHLVQVLSDTDAEVRRKVTMALGKLVEPLISALINPNSDIRCEAAGTLGEIKDLRAVEPLIIALKDTHQGVRQNAVWSLTQIKDIQAVEPLIELLKDESSVIRLNVASALGELRDSRAVDSLIVALDDASSEVRQNAIWALGRIKDIRSIKPLVDKLKDADLAVRMITVKSLAEIREYDTLKELINLLYQEENMEVRETAASALVALGVNYPYVAATLPVALKAKRPEIRYAVLGAMAQLDNVELIDEIITTLKTDENSDVRKRAVYALGTKKMIVLLLRFLRLFVTRKKLQKFAILLAIL
ncbi:MAG: HEAT repeat domain-containing protein [Blastocatellia bacterium]|nr:HEAT repeat domain-containing protein [Blastocatellia bacterium]